MNESVSSLINQHTRLWTVTSQLNTEDNKLSLLY